MSDQQVIVQPAAFQEAYQRDPGRLDETVDRSIDKAVGENESLQRARLVAAWNNAMGEFHGSDKGRFVMSSPQNGIASRLQTLLVQKSKEKGYVQQVKPAETVSTPNGDVYFPEILEVKFDNDDWWGWLSMSWKLIFKPTKHDWVEPPTRPEEIEDDAKIAIFSDWGSGLYGAPPIANSVAKLDRCDVALHLGDTYYSGSDDEIRDRLVGDWPKCSSKTVSRTLNGNHEMYSGGQGYFSALFSAPFKQPASCFAMQNSKWLLICLDTAYVDFDLDPAQVDWATKLIDSSGGRKVILFSHHQPFSQMDSQGPNLQAALHGLLDQQRIYAWYFGHEHRLMIYEPHSQWGVRARLVGHGGFPEFRDTVEGCGGDEIHFVHLGAKPYAPAAELLDGPNEYISDDPAGYSPHGYVVLDFSDAKAFETYYAPGGETIRGRREL